MSKKGTSGLRIKRPEKGRKLSLAVVEFYVVRDEEGGDTVSQLEATVLQFSDHSELLRVYDSLKSVQVDQGSSNWMKAHSYLSKSGILRGTGELRRVNRASQADEFVRIATGG